jgi:flagellar protein FliO/FliZ
MNGPRRACLLLLGLLACPMPLFAETSANPASIPSATAGLQQSLIGLLIVLAVIAALAWLMRRIPGRGLGSARHLKVVDQLTFGGKERLSLVEVADTWLVIGITPTQLNTLHVMPKSVSLPADPDISAGQQFSRLFDMIRSRKPNE